MHPLLAPSTVLTSEDVQPNGDKPNYDDVVGEQPLYTADTNNQVTEEPSSMMDTSSGPTTAADNAPEDSATTVAAPKSPSNNGAPANNDMDDRASTMYDPVSNGNINGFKKASNKVDMLFISFYFSFRFSHPFCSTWLLCISSVATVGYMVGSWLAISRTARGLHTLLFRAFDLVVSRHCDLNWLFTKHAFTPSLAYL